MWQETGLCHNFMPPSMIRYHTDFPPTIRRLNYQTIIRILRQWLQPWAECRPYLRTGPVQLYWSHGPEVRLDSGSCSESLHLGSWFEVQYVLSLWNLSRSGVNHKVSSSGPRPSSSVTTPENPFGDRFLLPAPQWEQGLKCRIQRPVVLTSSPGAFFFPALFFCHTGTWTQGLVCTRQVWPTELHP